MSGGNKKKKVVWSAPEWARWSRAPRYGSIIEVRGMGGIACLKVPMASTYPYAEEAVFSVTMFVERIQRRFKRRLALALDATLYDVEWHDPLDWDDWDVPVEFMASDEGAGYATDDLPTLAELDAAMRLCAAAFKRQPNGVVAVYSVDGCNTAGCVTVAALVELGGASLKDALATFAKARPPGVFSRKHLDVLAKRYDVPVDHQEPPEWHGGFPQGAPRARTLKVRPPAAAPKAGQERPPAAATNKRPRCQQQPAQSPAPQPATETVELRVVAPDKSTTTIARFVRGGSTAPGVLLSTPDAYEKDLAKLANFKSQSVRLAGDCEPRKLKEFLGYLVARKKAAVIGKKPHRIYIEPQQLLEGHTLKLTVEQQHPE